MAHSEVYERVSLTHIHTGVCVRRCVCEEVGVWRWVCEEVGVWRWMCEEVVCEEVGVRRWGV